MTDRVFIVGCGDIGERTARLWQQKGCEVSGLARSQESVERLEGIGVDPVRGDLDRPATLDGLSVAGTLVYYFAPPPAEGGSDSRMEAFLAGIAEGDEPEKIVYISTSGVYGDQGGALVDETVTPAPRTERSQRRFAAEKTLRDWERERGVPVVILRVPGIYGPGRLPLDRLRGGMAVVREEEAPPTNRIHADDLARICFLAGERGGRGDTFNVGDGCEGTMSEYFLRVAELWGLPRPESISMQEAHGRLSPAMLSYLQESRRLDTTRLREKLGFEPLYPDLKAGLQAIRAEEEQ